MAARRDEVSFADNPARAVERFKEAGRGRFLTSEELARLGDVLREGEALGLPYAVDETKAKAKNAPKPDNRRVKLDVHEVAADPLRYPDRRTSPRNSGRAMVASGLRARRPVPAGQQTGKKPVYLRAAAQSVLAAIPRIKDNPHIIAGAAKGAPRADLHRPWKAVLKAAGIDGVRVHDLRHSFASFGAGASLGLPIIGKLLGHSQAATTHRYAHLDADPLRRAVETIGNTIAAAMASNESRDNVVALPTAKR